MILAHAVFFQMARNSAFQRNAGTSFVPVAPFQLTYELLLFFNAFYPLRASVALKKKKKKKSEKSLPFRARTETAR